MKGQEKLFYEAPTTLVFEVKTEGFICVSTRGYDWNEEDE